MFYKTNLLLNRISCMNEYKRICLVGEAASGKTWLCEQMIEAGYNFPLSYTTRPQRDSEVNGQHYHFRNRTTFEEMITNNLMYEYVEFRGWLYGRTNEDFYNGNLLIMTPAGISQMSEKDLDESFIIYIDIAEDIRRDRLDVRLDSDNVERRLNADFEDFKDFEDFNYRVTNPEFTYAQVQMTIDRFLKGKLKQTV